MSYWAQSEERVRLGCEAFLDACRAEGFDGDIDKRLAQEWAQGMRDWLVAFGEDWKLLAKTVKHMRAQEPPLIVASPRSCIKVARELSQWQRPEKDYIHGQLSDFIEH